MRDIEPSTPSCDWWRLRRATRERGGPLPSIDVADALLDERRELTERVPNLRCATGSIPTC